MSTSEYENQNHKEWKNLFPSTIEPVLPDDFTEEDVAFAQQLGTLFSPADEILPPYYAQTLMQAESPRYTIVDDAFAHKTKARVFRELKLRRRLFSRRRSPLGIIGQTLHDITIHKSLLAWAATLMLVMMMTVAFTAPSFEQGVAMLVQGSHSGVLKVHKAPHVTHRAADYGPGFRSYSARPTLVPVVTLGHVLNFPLYWPQWIPANYSLDTIRVYEYSDDSWADGPVVDLVYDVDVSHAAPKGTGQIVIREFQPLQQVLQVVQDGYAFPIDPADPYGDNPRAIYVDGQWMSTGKMPPLIWKHGGRSEVIYQQNNVVFWIAGDQRDGNNEQVLWKMAQSLQTTPPLTAKLLKNIVATILMPNSQVAFIDPFVNDIVYSASLDGSSGQYYMTMSAYVSGKLASKVGLHGS